jgi:hypothetical protein
MAGDIFVAEQSVRANLADALMRLAPANPFFTSSYGKFLRALGHETWILGIERGGTLISGCYAILTSGYVNRTLRIASLPAIDTEDIFWEGLRRFCADHRISRLELNTIGSSEARIPPVAREGPVENILEYVMKIDDSNWEQNIDLHHRRKIRKALQSGITVRRTTDAAACNEHVRLMATSMERRWLRGESIKGDHESHLREAILLTTTGAGHLFHAVAGDEILSSVLVLRATHGAYYASSGTSVKGMQCGACHLLIYSVARTLQEESVRIFNLSNAEAPGPGLRQFKQRFGAAAVPLQCATFYLGSSLRKTLAAGASSIQRARAGLFTGWSQD